MNQETAFVYRYSAKENKEIQDIRRKYLPREESKLEELKRLDCTVQKSGVAESLCVGCGGALVFGFGMCLAMEVIWGGVLSTILGVILGIMGIGIMLGAYPVYRKILSQTKEKLVPRILELASELTGENN